MPFYITGGGDQSCYHAMDKDFMENIPNNSKILAIPLAVDPEEYDEVMERAEECFNNKKVSEIILCSDPAELEESDIEDYAAIFIEGGNTFQLVKTVRQSPIFNLLENFLENDGIIYADSAGAIILGSSVKTAFLGETPDEDHERIQDLRGLGLIDNWSIHCHFELEESDDINDLLYEEGYPIICLPETTAVKIMDNDLTVFGTGDVDIFTFTTHKSVAAGTSICLEQILNKTG